MKKTAKKFEAFEHTADVGLKIYGKDFKELFHNAANGLFSFITDLKKVKAHINREISLKEDNIDELLISWLNELIFQFSAHNFIPKKIKINNITSNIISAELIGEKIDLSRHKILSEIKAATYHELEIKDTKGGLEAKVILDT